MVITPAVIGSGSAECQGAAEIRERECRDLLIHAELSRGGVERVERLADLLQVVLLLPRLAAMSIERAKAAEEDLASDANLRVETDDVGNFLQLEPDLG